jgi:hypothetical protein
MTTLTNQGHELGIALTLCILTIPGNITDFWRA